MVFGNLTDQIDNYSTSLIRFGFRTNAIMILLNYSIYLTDATPDNMVVNKATLHLTIVDLDSLVIVDSHTAQTNTVNRYEQIGCEYCFAFIPDELCSHRLSDINLFSVCQVCLCSASLRKFVF